MNYTEIEYEDDKLYTCNRCYQELPHSAYFKSASYPVSRDYCGSYCKICVKERAKDIDENPELSRVYQNDSKSSYELLEKIGYDISDLQNNSIHTQFLKKYEGIINKPKKVKTEEEKKEERREYYRQYMLKRRG